MPGKRPEMMSTFQAQRWASSQVGGAGEAYFDDDGLVVGGSLYALGPRPWFDVMAFGAYGDGTQDDSRAIQQAINAASQTGGGIVFLPAGAYRCNVTLKARVCLQGAGQYATTLQGVAGANADVVKGQDFATLTGKAKATGDYLRGCPQASIRDLTVDGDKSHNAAGCGVRLWGAGLEFSNLRVQNCVEDGFYTEFTTADAYASSAESHEGNFQNIRAIGNGGNGWTFRGPHDSVLRGYVAYNNGGWALRMETLTGYYRGGLGLFEANSYLNSQGSFYVNADASFIVSSAATGAYVGTGIEIAASVGSVKITDVMVAGHAIGLLLRGTNNTFRGCVENCRNATDDGGVGIQIDAAGNCLVDVSGVGNYRAIEILSEVAPNTVRGNFHVATGHTLYSGTISLGSILEIVQSGDLGTGGVLHFGLGALGFYGATPQTKPTVAGSRGGNAALASLITQLAALGLITDSSTA